MSKSEQLRLLRAGTVINFKSKKQENDIIIALRKVESSLKREFKIALDYSPHWYIKDIVTGLRRDFPGVDLDYHFASSSLRPDGGILFLVDEDGRRFPVLIGEVKNQGTNDRRVLEGLARQAKGNAIERLGKNVIGLRTAMMTERIFPFICFGYGCDFADDSSILDRVSTIAMFGKLNRTHLHHQGPNGEFNRGSFYFREEKWTVEEMTDVMLDISRRSIQYYFSCYGDRKFILDV